jgi:mannose-6-phosphate isomerase
MLIAQYGSSDIGILFSCFFNILNLKIGESFVISPDEPHAYISGDLIECMVNSDNVIRGGLTPKLKDTKNLMELVKYEFKERKQNAGVILDNGMIEYKTGYEEFMVTKLSLSDEQTVEKSFNSLSIAIVLSGEANVEIEGFETSKMQDKCCYYIMPGQKFKIKTVGADTLLVFFASCDI